MASPGLEIQLLGDFRMLYGGRIVPGVNTPRLRALLAYLLIHRRAPQRREHLAGLFWPDSPEAQARTNLRRELHHLRRAFPEIGRFVELDTAAIQWRMDAPAAIDLAVFEEALAQAARARQAGHDDEHRHALEAAVEACCGDLLPGCYDDPILEERERLRSDFATALHLLIEALAKRGELAAALRQAARLLRHDPLNEVAHRWLMELRARSGDCAGAHRAFEACAEVLRRELHVGPSAATRTLHARLLQAEPLPPPALPTASKLPGLPRESFPLIGREREWTRLHEAWRATSLGQPRFILIRGDAGIGKTRLAEEMLTWGEQQGFLVAPARSYAAEGAMSYAPVIEWLRAPAMQARWRNLDVRWRRELARLMPEALGVEEGTPREATHDPALRQRLFEALARATCAGGGPPRVFLLDDLQWSDRETVEWLHYLLRFSTNSRLLVLGTVRDTDAAPDHPLWTLALHVRERDQLTELRLGPLDAVGTAALAGQIADGRLDAERAARLYRETEGFPLFIVESVRGDLSTGPAGEEKPAEVAGARASSLPPKVHALIMQRLGQLSAAARDLAGVCATVGRAFTLDVLRRTVTQGDEALAGALDELARRGIVREQSLPGAYDFSHDRIREVAYDALGAARRQVLHRRIAETLVEMRAGDLDRASAEIAAHFDHAGNGESALTYYRRAGEMALRLFANRHAITLFSRARELLEHSPPSPERDRTELALLTALGVALVAVEGWGTADVIALYTRAAELGEKLEGRLSAPVLRGQALARLLRGDLAGSNDLGAQLLQQARRERDPALRVEAYYVKGVNSFWRGEFDLSRRQLQTALAGWDPRRAREHIALFAQNPGVVCGARLGHALWFLGRADRARHEVDEAIALARRMEHPLSLAYVLYFAAWMMNDCGDFDRVRVLVEELAVHILEHDLGIFSPMIAVIRGWLRARAGEPRAALQEMGRALEKYRAAGNNLHRSYAITLLARTHVLAGEIELGLIALDDAAAIAHETGQRFLDAELLRLRAEFLAQQFAAPELIRRFLRQACAIARRQGAIALELRAALSLARVEERAGQRAKGCAGLRPVFARFREGFDTADLREAAQLLNG